MKYSKRLLLDFYRTMVRIRQCEESLVESILSKDVRCPCHLYSGEEAIAVGVCRALRKTDFVFGTHRSHGHYLAKGGDMAGLVAEIYCRETGCCRGRGGSMHLIAPEQGMLGSAPIVAGTIPLALGAALASAIRDDRRVAVCFFGDGATGEGVLYESLNFASLWKLPIIFVCENNLYSTHMPLLECRAHNNIAETAKPFRVTSLRLDGNDVLKVHAAAQKAVDMCRRGEGPVFLECLTYRFRGHVGPDDNIQGSHTDIRPPEEILRWKKKDPIARFEKYLIAKAGVDRSALGRIVRRVDKEVAEAHEFAKRSPFPEKGALTQDVFQE